MQVREIMTSSPDVLDSDTAVHELESRLISHRVGGFPVVDDGKLVGIVTRSDLVRVLDIEHTFDDQLGDGLPGSGADDKQAILQRGARIGARLAAMTVADVMVRNVSAVLPGDEVAEAARVMVEGRVHRLPVVEDGRLVGIVTSIDLARLIADRTVS